MAGLPWFKVSVDLPRHKKSVILASRLGIQRAWTHVVELWAWIAEFEATGEIVGPDAAVLVAQGAGWGGDPEVFCRAMVAAGFLDATAEGFRIHDWSEWAGAHIEKKAKDATRKKNSRRGKASRAADVTRDSEPGHADVRVTSEPGHAECVAESATQRGESRDGRSSPPCTRENGSDDRVRILAVAGGNESIPLTLEVLKRLHAAGKAAASPARSPATRRRDEELIAAVGVEEAARRLLAAWNPAKSTLGWYSDVLAEDAAPTTLPARGQRENPRPGDPDFNDPDAWWDYDAWLARDSTAAQGGSRG